MQNKNLFLSMLIIFAILLGVVLIIGIIINSSEEETPLEILNKIEKVDNLLANYSFENELNKEKDWSVTLHSSKSGFSFDDIVKRKGKFSLSLYSEDTVYPSAIVTQRINEIQLDNKITLFGFIRTEDIDSVRLEIHLYDNKDSLLVVGYSVSLKGTNDWTELNTWVRTTDNNSSSIIIKGILFGKGYVWFDNMRLYTLPIKQPYLKLPI